MASTSSIDSSTHDATNSLLNVKQDILAPPMFISVDRMVFQNFCLRSVVYRSGPPYTTKTDCHQTSEPYQKNNFRPKSVPPESLWEPVLEQLNAYRLPFR